MGGKAGAKATSPFCVPTPPFSSRLKTLRRLFPKRTARVAPGEEPSKTLPAVPPLMPPCGALRVQEASGLLPPKRFFRRPRRVDPSPASEGSAGLAPPEEPVLGTPKTPPVEEAGLPSGRLSQPKGEGVLRPPSRTEQLTWAIVVSVGGQGQWGGGKDGAPWFPSRAGIQG